MITRTLLLGAVAAVALAANAQAARVDGWYISLEGGANWIDDNEFDWGGEGAPGVITDFDNAAEYDTGWVAMASVGYGFGHWRTEIEGGYRVNDMDQFSSAAALNHYASGEVREVTIMANVHYDFRIAKRLMLSLGVGAGGDFAAVEVDTVIDDDEWNFAYQGIAGLSYAVSPRVDLVVNYRYLRAQGPTVTSGNGVIIEEFDDFSKHAVTAGLRYSFGVEEAPPPPPPMVEAPPPPPPPPEIQTPREFIVFFGHNQSNLTAEALDVIRQAAMAAKSNGTATVTLVGHADRSGSNKYNEALAMKRGNTVKGALVSEGVPDSAISVTGKGEEDPLVPTADGVREPQNRRVHISL